MTTEQRQERIKALRRQGDREKRLSSLLTELSNVANKQFSENNVLTIEQIDKHQTELNCSDFSFNFLNISFPTDKATDISNLLLALNNKLSETNYFTLYHFSNIAVLDISTEFVIDKFEDIVKLDGDSFSIYDHNYKNGLWVDLFQEYWYLDNEPQFIWIYELRVFGKEWIKCISEKM